MKLAYYISLFCLIFLSCSKSDVGTEPESIEEPEEPIEETPKNPLIQLNGTDIVDANGNTLYLKGVAFGNQIWSNSSTPGTTHHNELDFERVKNMGMNAVRFYMNYTFFEDDSNPYTYKQSGWNWLDQNIQWAKNHNVYLILNMHAPQGGYQSQGEGDALWDNVENQNRLVALWKAIAEKYKDEVQIAGFGPVNEPVPTQSINQWSSLAQKLINGIREVNENHLIFIEKAIYVEGNYDVDDNLNFPQVTGKNLVYEFHSYDPHTYTHQLFDWANLGEGGKYPDENILEITNGQWYTAIFGNDKLSSENSDWTYFEGIKYTIDDTQISYAVPALVGQNVDGTVYFDDIIIKEYDETGNFIRDIYEFNFDDDSGWNYWSENDSGEGGLSNNEGINSSSCLYISSATSDSNMSGTSFRFIPQQGYQYQISGWMKGENVDATANCRLRLDFYNAETILKRNKAYLEWSVKRYVDWANAKGAPLYLGEFGAGIHCFENNKGGLQFVEDMLDIIITNKIHFTYHAYHEDAFGLYFGGNTLPSTSNANGPLIDLFTNTLN
ncbi:endoglucanase [Flaviramulus basaltis]|uniref:Exo-1,3-beta-glucanase D n=1 Tax=Flaviramulus basaltis TaxID=369401 RepID=A0A1K2IPZ8_9FLAO|nr:cellulase family glycosylhydrolase [Flaviramulus basaltis]SFZ94382.1 endoglucanase [Flaviramulus basaltis]